MARIYRVTDKIELKIGDLTVRISPLNLEQKAELGEIAVQSTKDVKKAYEFNFRVIKFAVKEVEGLKDIDDKDYKLEFENGVLTDNCVQDLMNIEHQKELIDLCNSFANFIPNELPEGVKAIPNVKTPKKK